MEKINGEPNERPADYFAELPNEILVLVFTNMDFLEQRPLRRVCLRWNDILLSPPVLRHISMDLGRLVKVSEQKASNFLQVSNFSSTQSIDFIGFNQPFPVGVAETLREMAEWNCFPSLKHITLMDLSFNSDNWFLLLSFPSDIHRISFKSVMFYNNCGIVLPMVDLLDPWTFAFSKTVALEMPKGGRNSDWLREAIYNLLQENAVDISVAFGDRLLTGIGEVGAETLSQEIMEAPLVPWRFLDVLHRLEPQLLDVVDYETLDYCSVKIITRKILASICRCLQD